jgi:hypothetical protein
MFDEIRQRFNCLLYKFGGNEVKIFLYIYMFYSEKVP